MNKRPNRQNKNTKFDEKEASPYESTTVGVYRTAATVKGGRRFSFSALSVVGDRKGQVGYGYGKATEVPAAIEKAEKVARREVKKVSLKEGTIPHEVLGRFGAAKVNLVPASPGTGVIAGTTVRAVLELAGVRDCMTKAYGSTNQKNLVKATVNALEKLHYKSVIEQLRNVDLGETEVDEMIKRGAAFLPTVKATPAQQPAKTEKKPGGQKKKDSGEQKVVENEPAVNSDASSTPTSTTTDEEAPAASAAPTPAPAAESAPVESSESATENKKEGNE